MKLLAVTLDASFAKELSLLVGRQGSVVMCPSPANQDETDLDQYEAIVVDADSPRSMTEWGKLVSQMRVRSPIWVSADTQQMRKITTAWPDAIGLTRGSLTASLLWQTLSALRDPCRDTPHPTGHGPTFTLPTDVEAASEGTAEKTDHGDVASAVLRRAMAPMFPLVEEIAATQRWLAAWRNSANQGETTLPASLLQRHYEQLFEQVRAACDISQLSDDRAVIRRDLIELTSWLTQSLPEGCACRPTSGTNPPPAHLRIDIERAQAALRTILRHLERESGIDSVEWHVGDEQAEVTIATTESMDSAEFLDISTAWESAAWPDWSSENEFTGELGLARERLRCMGGDMVPVLTREGAFGFELSLPLDSPAGITAGFRQYLLRRIDDPSTPLGAFLIQSDGAADGGDELTDDWLRERLGSCGLVIRRSARTWVVMAPVGADEASDFVQWLQESWTSARGRRLELHGESGAVARGTPQLLAISTLGHLTLMQDAAAWRELYETACAAIGPLGSEPPVVVISRAASTEMADLAQHLTTRGCHVTQVSAQAPCPEEWLEVEPRVLDLRSDDDLAWQYLADLVRHGGLNRQVILLNESLQRQNERLTDVGRLFQTDFQAPVESVSAS